MKIKADCDVLLIGAGIMSATLATLLKELDPTLSIDLYERLEGPALESTYAWNNAGTGHSALCELNYTPLIEGRIDISKALKINESFEVSKQFWAFLMQNGYLESSANFINPVPHVSMVFDNDISYLQQRYKALIENHLFSDLEFSEDREKLVEWIPLIMRDQPSDTKIAATYSNQGADVDFGAITRSMFEHLKLKHDLDVFFNQDVQNLWQDKNGLWHVKIEHTLSGKEKVIVAKYVFNGAGGGALSLLEKSNIPEGEGFGGFPVSGQWLACYNQDLINAHNVKVYGKAEIGAPPMSVPHLDTRFINGKKALLFGPYAGFTTKFLKHGSWLDLPRSIDFDNISTMFGAWIHNFPLTKYLISQVAQSFDDKMKLLRIFLPSAKEEDWKLFEAGKRVQILKKDEKLGGILEFGTEIITSQDRTFSSLLGASPGASTSVSIMLGLLHDCFPQLIENNLSKLKKMIPSYGIELSKEKEKALGIIETSNRILGMKT